MLLQTSLTAILLFVLVLPAAAQQTEAEYLLDASRPVALNRYEKIRGTPYRYDAFLPGTIYDITLNPYELDSLNYNGFTHQFEYYVGGELRELANNNFLRAVINLGEDESHVYGWNLNPKFRNHYAELLYSGEFVSATLVYEVVNDEKVVQDVGETKRLQRFNKQENLYASVDGDLIPLSNSPKRLAADLGYRNEITDFIKEHKLKPSDRQDLVKILAYADELHASR